ncbi:hypothetical protein CYMTET_13706 [Cymbomonas tetramitiformis]|uniref:Uncharacterized protein n=1 Tax=Cymbomonas tetramitiformis TaxID=36881 RepID=A0AAE0GHJ2_9CHLO|nr:hypothetical protein CYMTET_13706 [Cymbomonas tetramitiformis]
MSASPARLRDLRNQWRQWASLELHSWSVACCRVPVATCRLENLKRWLTVLAAHGDACVAHVLSPPAQSPASFGVSAVGSSSASRRKWTAAVRKPEEQSGPPRGREGLVD